MVSGSASDPSQPTQGQERSSGETDKIVCGVGTGVLACPYLEFLQVHHQYVIERFSKLTLFCKGIVHDLGELTPARLTTPPESHYEGPICSPCVEDNVSVAKEMLWPKHVLRNWAPTCEVCDTAERKMHPSGKPTCLCESRCFDGRRADGKGPRCHGCVFGIFDQLDELSEAYRYRLQQATPDADHTCLTCFEGDSGVPMRASTRDWFRCRCGRPVPANRVSARRGTITRFCLACREAIVPYHEPTLAEKHTDFGRTGEFPVLVWDERQGEYRKV